MSWKRDPKSFAVDAFTLKWSAIYFYAFPPFPLIAKVLNKILYGRAEGIVLVPDWKTAPSILKQYNTTYAIWLLFCTHLNVDVFNPSVHDIIQFLDEQFKFGAAYSSLNTHRSALSFLSTKYLINIIYIGYIIINIIYN